MCPYHESNLPYYGCYNFQAGTDESRACLSKKFTLWKGLQDWMALMRIGMDKSGVENICFDSACNLEIFKSICYYTNSFTCNT